MTKLVAILGGGDWYDASVDLLSLPENMDLNWEWKGYRQWSQGYNPKKDKYFTFPEWLETRGASQATDDQIIVFDEDC